MRTSIDMSVDKVERGGSIQDMGMSTVLVTATAFDSSLTFPTEISTAPRVGDAITMEIIWSDPQ